MFPSSSGEPTPLFHVQYDDARMGREDLEEHEVVEAIVLMSQEMPEKVRAKYEKRLEIIAAVQQAKKNGVKEPKGKAREEAKKFKAQREGERSGDLDAVVRYRGKRLRDVCQEKEEGVTGGMIMPWSSSDKVVSVCVCSCVFECACALARTKPHNIKRKSS
jgi:hypothetical protein